MSAQSSWFADDFREAEFYRCVDSLRSGLPEGSGTQDFVFSNAVLQHFDDHEIDKISPAERDVLEAHTREGWRLFPVFPVERIVEMAGQDGLTVISNILSNEEKQVRGVITYRSGKKMPTACVVLEKNPDENQQ